TAFKLAKEFNLDSPKKALSQIKELAEKGKIRGLSGFGEESENRILQNVEKFLQKENRLPLYLADKISLELLDYLAKSEHIKRVDALGSLRRRYATIGDIDIAVASENSKEAIEHFVKYPKILKIVSKGDIKATVILMDNIQVDIMVNSPDSYGSLLQHFTGSKLHNIHLRKITLEKGYSLSERGIKTTSQTLKFDTEEELYRFLGMQYVCPELREDWGEIERSLENKLPNLLSSSDIKGDLQSHTTFSDGENTFKEMADSAKRLGYEYFGITDHQMSLSTHTRQEVLSSIEARRKEIEHYNNSSKCMRVLFGIEINVSADNNVVYPNELLGKFDYVIGAIHSSFGQNKEQITKRLLTLIENPFIKIIAHPTGRLISEREGYNADWKEIFKACKRYNKVLEINGQPSRLDLPDFLVREAIKEGVLLSTNTDSHSVGDLNFMSYAVSVARRGWCEKKNVINTLPLNELLKFLNVV
ncbi:MAG: PHP domain-containing protein, partial [bacterium]